MTDCYIGFGASWAMTSDTIFRLHLQPSPPHPPTIYRPDTFILSDQETSIEMATGMIAACLPALKPLLTTVQTFFSNITFPPLPHAPAEPTDRSEPSSPQPQQSTFFSLRNFSLTRPKPACFPTRYYDHGSGLDFDLETPRSRTRTHSRHPSNLTAFSNFTNTHLAAPFEDERPASRARTCSKGLSDMDDDATDLRTGYAVSITSGETPYDGGEDAKSIRRVASSAESSVDEESSGAASGGIMKTTEVRIT